jgi:hypothetical protein
MGLAMTRSGSQKLAILLCKFSDTSDDEPHDKAYFDDLFVRHTTGGLNDYWTDVSRGALDLDGSEVFDWKTLAENRADYLAARPSRWDKIRGGIEAFGLEQGDYAGFVTIFNTDVGDAGAEGGVLAGPGDVNVTFLAHETGHLFGLSHSFDQSSRKDADWSAPGEYFDSYDVMSAMNVSSYDDPRFGQSGPRLCAANQDLMGWLPGERVWTPVQHQSSFTDLDLVSLGHPEVPGYLVVRAGGYYIEFRMNDGWDSGLSRPCVLIHSLIGANAVVIAQDAEHYINEWQPGQVFGPSDLEMSINGGTRISVISFDIPGRKARIRVHHQVAKPFVAGPATDVLGSVSVDGGGIIIVGGKIIKVPPRSPVLGLLSRLAMASQAEEGLGEEAKRTVTGAVFKEIEQLAKDAQRQ